MQLVLIAHGRGAALEIAHIGALVGHDQRAFELAGVGLVDTKVRRQFHRAANARRDVAERAVGKHGRVERRVVVVRGRHHAGEVLAHELRVILYCLAEGAENHPMAGQLRFESGGHRYRIEHGVNGYAREHFLLVKRDAQLIEGAQQLGVDLVEALEFFLHLWGRVVADRLQVDRLVVDLGPARLTVLGQALESLESLQSHVEQPLGLVLLARDHAYDVGRQARRRGVRFDVGDKAVLVFGVIGNRLVNCSRLAAHTLLSPEGLPSASGPAPAGNATKGLGGSCTSRLSSSSNSTTRHSWFTRSATVMSCRTV